MTYETVGKSIDANFTKVTGAMGAAGPGSSVVVLATEFQVWTVADHLGRFTTGVLASNTASTVVVDDAAAIAVAVPHEDSASLKAGALCRAMRNPSITPAQRPTVMISPLHGRQRWMG